MITLLSAIDEQIDRLRNTEVFIIIGVLLLWCASIYIFIRHSELLRIRYRNIPYSPASKLSKSLHHSSMVHRVSDVIAHPKPMTTSTTTLVLTNPLSNRISEQAGSSERKSLCVPQPWNIETNITLCESNSSIKYVDNDDQLLDPQMIPVDVRRRLLDLHRKSVDNLSGIRYSISYPGNELSVPHETNDEEQENTTEDVVHDP